MILIHFSIRISDGRCPQKEDGSYDCYTDIQEVVLVKPKKVAQPQYSYNAATPVLGLALGYGIVTGGYQAITGRSIFNDADAFLNQHGYYIP